MILKGCPHLAENWFPSGTIITDICSDTFKPCKDNKNCHYKKLYNKQLCVYYGTNDEIIKTIVRETLDLMEGKRSEL